MSASGSSLAGLFPEEDYRFHLTLRRGEPAAFFRPEDSSGDVLRERTRWLTAEPARYSALLPEGELPLAEFAEQLGAWGLAEVKASWSVIQMGSALEPDFVLLIPDANGVFRLCAGAVCFPSGWALVEKVGQPLESIHSAVPGLNAALASPIQQFLSRLKPGPAFLRANWGLAASQELNLHPARRLLAPSGPVSLERLWLRVEQQALVCLPRSGGVLFGIRIELHRLDEVVNDVSVARGLARALVSMPEPMAAYKGLASIRAPLIELLKNY